MHKLWNSAGAQMLKYYKDVNECECIFRERTKHDDNFIIGDANDNFQVSFVIDATASMQVDIDKAKESVCKLISNKHLLDEMDVVEYISTFHGNSVIK